ncbi:hypothetical protein WJX81_004076 [Elliptochloris bilobata]|uniref:Pre-mRNA-splicing factor SLU7 n=1 Tax=Elliptochloris bilobata TaxID=381761 RepID=A0AAW1RN51_9CHLO
MASSSTLMSHEDFRRAKELEEARKAGIAPAAVDEEGKEINPHIPQYMSSAPWYLNNSQPSLKHQKDWRTHAKDEVGKFYDRGVKVFQAKKYRKGACENCGALSHKTKDCVERPRSKGARWTSKHIAADEKVEDIQLKTYEARRDRWNGYDAGEYSRVVDMYEKVEDAKREMRKKQELDERFKTGKDGAVDSDEDSDVEDEDKIRDVEEGGFAKLEKRVRTTGGGSSGTVRNLRIREDTAKYLLNLDPNSAHYDPKSRSMREDPLPYKDASQKTFVGDNVVRRTGDYFEWERLAVHAYTAHDKGQDIHVQASPSQAEALFRQFKAKKEVLVGKSKESVVATYGSAAQPADEAALLLGQTEAYVEYDARGRLLRGDASTARSRYEEDAYPGNHTSVWGSWWQDGRWGFACCHQTARNSYCTGAAGEAAAMEAALQMAANLESRTRQADREAEDGAAAPPAKPKADVWGTDVAEDLGLDDARLAAALRAQEAADAVPLEADERKRAYNSVSGGAEVTAEEMEAYRLKKARMEDPLAALYGTGTSGYNLV